MSAYHAFAFISLIVAGVCGFLLIAVAFTCHEEMNDRKENDAHRH